MNWFAARLERHGLWFAVAGFLLTRVVVWVAAYAAPQDRARPDAAGKWWSDVPLMRWDGGHYGHIQRLGYPPQINDTTAFFPAYPLLSRPLMLLFHPDWALVLTSQIASLIGVIFFYSWAKARSDARTAFGSVLLLSCYPPAFFFSAAYGDGVFFLCVALALWLLDRKQFTAAAGVCAVATAVRPPGLMLAFLATLWIWMRRPYRSWPRRIGAIALLGALSVSGLAAFQFYLWQHYGRFDAWTAAQQSWSPKPVPRAWSKALTLRPVLQPALQPFKCVIRGVRGEPGAFAKLLEPFTWNMTFNVLILFIAGAGLYRPRNIPRLAFLLPILLFLIAYLPDPVTGERLVGIARYQLVALPCFVWLAGWSGLRRWPAVFIALLAALLAFQTIYVAQFCNWILVS